MFFEEKQNKYVTHNYPGNVFVLRGFISDQKLEEIFSLTEKRALEIGMSSPYSGAGFFFNLFTRIPEIKKLINVNMLTEVLQEKLNLKNLRVSNPSDFTINYFTRWHTDAPRKYFQEYLKTESHIYQVAIFKNIGLYEPVTEFQTNFRQIPYPFSDSFWQNSSHRRRRFIIKISSLLNWVPLVTGKNQKFSPVLSKGDLLVFPIEIWHQTSPLPRRYFLKKLIFKLLGKRQRIKLDRRCLFFTIGVSSRILDYFEKENVKRAEDQISLYPDYT